LAVFPVFFFYSFLGWMVLELWTEKGEHDRKLLRFYISFENAYRKDSSFALLSRKLSWSKLWIQFVAMELNLLVSKGDRLILINNLKIGLESNLFSKLIS
jgi:hypothetical protein